MWRVYNSRIFMSHNHVLHTLMQARLSTNKSARTILVILLKAMLVKSVNLENLACICSVPSFQTLFDKKDWI